MKTRNLLFAAAALTSFASYGQAAESGYFGLSLGEAEVTDLCESNYDCDDKAMTGRIYGGVQFNGFAGVEFGYRYIDEVSASLYEYDSGWGYSYGAEITGHFVDTTALFSLPETGPVQVVAKAGVMLWLLDYDFEVNSSYYNETISENESGLGLRTGLGARFNLSDSFSLRADWDYLVNAGDDLMDSDIHIFSAGPEIRF